MNFCICTHQNYILINFPSKVVLQMFNNQRHFLRKIYFSICTYAKVLRFISRNDFQSENFFYSSQSPYIPSTFFISFNFSDPLFRRLGTTVGLKEKMLLDLEEPSRTSVLWPPSASTPAPVFFESIKKCRITGNLTMICYVVCW